MKLYNQLLNYKFNSFEYISLILFSILPISFLIGNAAINLNIALIDILFLFYSFRYRFWKWLKRDIFQYLICLNIFLLLNSLYSFFLNFDDPSGVFRSFLFFKFILLIFAFEILLKNKIIISLVHKFWLLIISIVIIDIFFEKTFGYNVVGNISPDGTRIISFFKDEMIVGAFLLCFGFTVVTFFLNNDKNNNKKIFFTLLLILIPISIFLSGERSNFIKSFLIFFIIIFCIQNHKIFLNKKYLFLIFIFLIIIFLTLNQNTFIKYTELFKRIKVSDQDNIYKKFENIKYFAHYETALSIFKNYPFLGVGNKNFRNECVKEKYYKKDIKFTESRCSTHPHQIHFEILSEQGILGYLTVLYIMIFFLIKNIKNYNKTKNINHLCNIVYLTIFFVPLLPGSGIFSTLSGSMFWVIFALCNSNYEQKTK